MSIEEETGCSGTAYQHETPPELAVFLCRNSIPDAHVFPMQWADAGIHIRVKLVPCSGKIDIQYMLHALEAGKLGVCAITCPHGECTLAQGNYRAGVRVRTLRKLLEEIGLDTERAVIVNCPPGATAETVKSIVGSMAQTLADSTAATACRRN